MEAPPEPKGSNDMFLQFLKQLMGEDGLRFLNLDNAITAVRQGQPVWQAPFVIGLNRLPFLYNWETDGYGTGVPGPAFLVSGLALQTFFERKDMTNSEISDFVRSALELLEAKYDSLSVEIPGYGLGDEQAHTLFHTRFALGVLLLITGDEKRAATILRKMAATKTSTRGPTASLGVGLDHWDVGVTKALAAIVLQDFYARRQDYELALYLLTEAATSNGPGFFSENLLGVVPGLLESFAEKCERINSLGEWIDLFDRAADVTEVCGEADVSGELPSDCKETSPQFLAWKFGQLVGRFAIRYRLYPSDSKQPLPSGYQDHRTMIDSMLRECGLGDDWGNGSVVASLLCECDEHRNWQILRQQHVSMWESLSRYQWLSLYEAGPRTDLYWAMRIGFADKMLETPEKGSLIPAQSESLPIIRDIEMTKDIVSTIALRQLKEQQDSDKMRELLQEMLERVSPGKREVHHELQQRLGPVWSKLPATVVDALIQAENYYKTGVNTNDAKVWFHRAVEACLDCCLVDPLVNFMQKRANKKMAVCFSPPRGVERRTSHELRKLPLRDWSDVFETLSSADRSLSSLGTEDLKRFMKEHFGVLDLPALRELSRSLRDFCQQRKDSAHYHIPRYEEERQELEQMRELVLGIKRPSVITQIFQLFGA